MPTTAGVSPSYWSAFRNGDNIPPVPILLVFSTDIARRAQVSTGIIRTSPITRESWAMGAVSELTGY